MSEDLSNPLLSLVKEQGLIDDLQYEEMLGEFKRTGKSVSQILQDSGVLDLDTILQAIAGHLGAPVVTVRDRDLTPELIRTIPAKMARMYQCLPVSQTDSTLQVALVEPLNSGRIDELGFVLKKDIQLVVADPAQVQKAIEKFYPEDNESINDILNELGSDKELAKEVSELAVTDDATLMARLADQAPIVRFVNLVLFQAVQDRASDIHFERSEEHTSELQS